MGKLSWWDSLKVWLKNVWPCWLVGHRFKYEPMPGDEPPHEFENCAICGAPNLNLYQYYDNNGC